MNAQQIYDKAALHLYTQNEVSTGPNYCLYRGPRGLKCAAGALIDNDWYSCNMEGNDATGVANMPSTPQWFKDHLKLIQALQHCHDTYEPEEWDKGLYTIASRFGLIPMARPAA